MKIYRQQSVVYDIRPEYNSMQRVEHMGENTLNLIFRVTEQLDLRVNDYVYFLNEKYKFKSLSNPTRHSRTELEYNCRLFSQQYDLQDVLYVLEDETGVGILDELIPICGTAEFHLRQLVKVVKKVHPAWSVGDIEQTAAEKNVVYEGMDCLQALQHLASEFNLEYWISGTTVALGKKRWGTPIVFKYGQGNALYELSRQNQEGRIVTALRVKGGERNVDTEAYKSKYLLLPGKTHYVFKNVAKFGTIQGRQDFPDIFPRLIHKKPSDPGRVQSVRVQDGDYYIKDANMFDVKLMKDRVLAVDFQTGQLAGMKIDAEFDFKTKEFRLIKGEYGLNVELPGGVFVPNAGDLYLLTNLIMPPEYVAAAEAELFEAGAAALDQLCEQKVSYKGVVNPLYFRQLNEVLETGRAVVVEDAALVDEGGSVELRIQSLTRNVGDDLTLEIEISDTLYVSRIDKIESELKENKGDTQMKITDNFAYTRRRWQDVMETMEMMFDPDGSYFTEIIKPLVVHTAQLIVGTNSQQLDFVDLKFIPNADDDPNIFKNTLGVLEHFTINTDGSIRSWNIPAARHPLNNAYHAYVYAKCPKVGTDGWIWVSNQKIKLEEIPGYYNFWIGVLNTPRDGVRSWQPNYGYTEIAGQQITTGLIKDRNARTVFDLVKGELYGAITLMPGSTGYDNLEGRPNMNQWSTDTVNKSRAFIESSKEDLAKNMGYANYASMQLEAQKGRTIISGGYVRTTLIDADTIFAQNLTAARIAALDITTSRLTVTDGAKIGGFNIEGGSLTATSNRITGNAFLKMESDVTSIMMGKNVVASTSGYPATCPVVIRNFNNLYGNRTTALMAVASGTSSNIPIGVDCQGGLMVRGSMGIVDQVYTPNTLFSPLEWTKALLTHQTFVFQPASNNSNTYLPTTSHINSTLGSFADGTTVGSRGFLRMTILLTRYSSGSLFVYAGDASTPLLNHNASEINGVEMQKGDVLQLGFFNGAWYTLSNSK